MSRSPDGDVHPGKVVFDDKTDGTVEERDVSKLPESMVWVAVEERWVPVVRIEITGMPGRMRMTSFGPAGEMLETTTGG